MALLCRLLRTVALTMLSGIENVQETMERYPVLAASLHPRDAAEALLQELQRNGAGLLTFLKAFRVDERLSHARLRVLKQLFLPDVTHHEADEATASEEAIEDEAMADEAASSATYDEMRQLEGPELDEVRNLLQHLASRAWRKAGFKQVFQRLLNAGNAERLLLEQIQATVQAQQGGSSKPVPGNAATTLMLQDISRTENWTLAVRRAVARYALIHRTRDIIETTRDLPLADARRLQGAHAHSSILARTPLPPLDFPVLLPLPLPRTSSIAHAFAPPTPQLGASLRYSSRSSCASTPTLCR